MDNLGEARQSPYSSITIIFQLTLWRDPEITHQQTLIILQRLSTIWAVQTGGPVRLSVYPRFKSWTNGRSPILSSPLHLWLEAYLWPISIKRSTAEAKGSGVWFVSSHNGILRARVWEWHTWLQFSYFPWVPREVVMGDIRAKVNISEPTLD